MNPVISVRTYPAPPVCKREILRYAGCREADESISELLDSCLREAVDRLSYKVCFCRLPVSVSEDICDFGIFELRSKNLAANLAKCENIILFAATVGVEIDRLIARYGRLSPAKALMLQAFGAERIEALCDVFCRDIGKELGVRTGPRFSPGYGDLPLDAQKMIFSVLGCEKRIGLFLNDSLLMSPSKSVTAFVGICGDKEGQSPNKCSACNKTDCAFRGAL